MTLRLAVVSGTFNDKKLCRPQNQFEIDPIDLDLQDEAALIEFFTSKIHSTWQYAADIDTDTGEVKNVATRNAKNTIALLAIAIDFDDGTLSFEQAIKRFKAFAGIIYISTNYTKEHPKLRVFLLLKAPLTNQALFQSACDWLKQEYPDADPEVFKVSQPLFPCCKFDNGKLTTGFPLFKFHVLTGKPFEFPPDALKVKVKVNKKSSSTNKGWEPPPDRYVETNKRELHLLLNYFKTNLIEKGYRDKELVRLCAKYRQCEYSENEVFKLLCDFNRDFVKPPYEEVDSDGEDKSIEQIVKHVFTNDIRPPAPENWSILQNAIKYFQPNELMGSELEQTLSRIPTLLKCGSLRAFDVVDLMQEPELTTPPKLALLGCAVIGSNNIIVGDSGSGKSTFLRSAVIQAAQNGKRTLWLSAEFERRAAWWFKRMYPHMKKGEILWVDTRFEERSIAYDATQRWMMLHEIVAEARSRFHCEFIILDSLLNWLKWLDIYTPENSDPAMWIDKVQMLGDLVIKVGCTPVIVHHTNKGGTFALSAGIKAACDNMWLFSQYGNNPNLRNLKVSKTRDGIEDYQVECFPENNFHYEVKKTKKVNDAGEESQSIQYPVWMIPLIQILMDGKVILRLELAKRTATKSPRMSQFKNSFDIQISKKSYSEEWQATPEQIKVWRTNGVKPLESGSVRDILNEESEEE